jgi:hypothetical protein
MTVSTATGQCRTLWNGPSGRTYAPTVPERAELGTKCASMAPDMLSDAYFSPNTMYCLSRSAVGKLVIIANG